MSLLWSTETLSGGERERERKAMSFTNSVVDRWIKKCCNPDGTEVITKNIYNRSVRS